MRRLFKVLPTKRGELISEDFLIIEIEFIPAANVTMSQLDIEASDDLLILKLNSQTVFKKSFKDKKLLNESLLAKFIKKHSKLVIKYKIA